MNHYCYEDIQIGQSEQFCVTITPEKMEQFRMMTSDDNPLHTSNGYAVAHGYSGKVCYGLLTASMLSTLAGVYLPGEKSLIHSVNINFVKPVLENEQLTVKGTVTAKIDTFQYITLKVEIFSENAGKVLRGVMTIGVRNA